LVLDDLAREACQADARPSRAAQRSRPRTIAHRMGFNPFRKQSTSILDVALVVGFIALTLAVVAWGFFG
jgi:hypothetical protein